MSDITLPNITLQDILSLPRLRELDDNRAFDVLQALMGRLDCHFQEQISAGKMLYGEELMARLHAYVLLESTDNTDLQHLVVLLCMEGEPLALVRLNDDQNLDEFTVVLLSRDLADELIDEVHESMETGWEFLVEESADLDAMKSGLLDFGIPHVLDLPKQRLHFLLDDVEPVVTLHRDGDLVLDVRMAEGHPTGNGCLVTAYTNHSAHRQATTREEAWTWFMNSMTPVLVPFNRDGKAHLLSVNTGEGVGTSLRTSAQGGRQDAVRVNSFIECTRVMVGLALDAIDAREHAA